MSEPLESVANGAADTKELAERLLAQAKDQGIWSGRIRGLLNELTKTVLGSAVEAEMTEHVGYEKRDRGTATPATEPGPRQSMMSASRFVTG